MKREQNINWELLSFEALGASRWHAVLKARAEVFVVEQNCVYCDPDDLDAKSHHLMGWSAPYELAAYLRLVPPGEKYPEPSIGRVLTNAAYRKKGLGQELMGLGIGHAERLYPGQGNRISAQVYLLKFYQTFGFRAISEVYDEDGIPHIEMLLSKNK